METGNDPFKIVLKVSALLVVLTLTLALPTFSRNAQGQGQPKKQLSKPATKQKAQATPTPAKEKQQMTDAEGHSDPDMFGRLSYKGDANDVTKNVTELDSLYNAKSVSVTVTLWPKNSFKDPIPAGDGSGTWYFRYVPSNNVNVNSLPVNKVLIQHNNTPYKDPNPVKWTQPHVITAKAGSKLDANVTVQLLRRKSDLSQWLETERQSYLSKSIAPVNIQIGSTTETFYVMKEIKLKLSTGTKVPPKDRESIK